MKKLFFAVIVIALLLSCSVSFASVGFKKDGENQGNAASIEVNGGLTEFDGNTVTIYSSGYKGGVTDVVTGKVTDIAGDDFLSYGVINFADHGTGVTSRSVAIANGEPGQMVTIILTACTGTFTLYITDDQVADGYMTKTGWDDIALNAALDSVTLLYIDDVSGWIIVGQNSVTVT